MTIRPPTSTDSGIEIKPLYGPPDGEVDPRIGQPGEFPFTRGIHAEMYRKRLWTMRQYSGFGDARSTNERFRSLMGAGQTGLSVAFDLPTQLGYDSDEPMAQPEVGRVGVAIDTLDDFVELFDGIPLDVANPSFTINAPSPVIAAMLVALAKRQGADLTKVRATFQNDMIKEFLTRGAYVFPPRPSVKLTGDVIEYCNTVVPSVYPISVSGSHIRDTGATGIQALAIVLSNALAYLDEAAGRGLDIVTLASRFSFLFAARQDPFVEAAQIRAARRLWATLLSERYGITEPAALKFRLFNSSNNQMFTRQDPLNIIIRGTLACLGGVLGGAQAITIIGYDEAYDIPTEDAQRVALRTQQVIAYETVIPATVDPLAGSYYVEALTDECEQGLRDFMATIDERGGVVAAVEDGWIKTLIYDRAYELEKGMANGEIPVVGVNAFAREDTEGDVFEAGDLHHSDDAIARRQIDRLVAVKATRDPAVVSAALRSVRESAERGTNVCWPIEEAVTVGATLGECMGALGEVYGRYVEGGRI
ncbi:MAG: methylmalonyl-CoA mutase, N-terminal domain [Pseudonocardiales bacterium]|nr:methylmalonyl-CoA mutase, N-terminal domain [Pseudonocardiales bacterium]